LTRQGRHDSCSRFSPSPDVAAALRDCRRAFWSVAFSVLVNLLMLAGPLNTLFLSSHKYWFTDPNIDGASEGGTLLNNGNPLTLAQTRSANYG
jgi:hypothetical protein